MAQTLAEAYIPVDRRQALATGTALPEKNEGATLFVDISGFTPLTNALRRHYGPRRGAEELTRHLNRVYTALITEIERYRGSVIGFSGDAITCWFAAAQLTADDLQTALQQAVTAAFAVQQAMQSFQSIQLSQQQTIHLAVKTAIAAGMTRRLLVGDPRIQCIDVLAGSTLDRMAATEQMAQQGELVLDAASMAIIAEMLTVREWRTNPGTGQQYAVIETLAPIAEPAPWPAQPPLADAQVASWVLPAIASRLAEGHDRFLAELRPAAALFLKFTGLDYDHDAEAAENLNRYISWAQQVIHRYGGALIQLTTGDKGSYFYATFGAPLAHDDDIGRAVAVALVLRSSPERYSFIKQVHIGISYGTMRVGAYGSESRRTYGVLGNETNMAARFMAHAQPGQIVTSQVVAAAITGHYVIEPLGDIQLKGRTEPQPLFAVLGQQTQRELSRMLYTTPLIGRDQELATLQERARQLQQGEGSLLRIEGGAGIGKSHMVATFTQSLDQSVAPVRMVRGSGQSTAQDTAYFALRQVMQELLLSTQDAMPSAEQIDQLMPTLTTRNPHWALRLPLLGDLLGVPIPDNATTATFDARLRQEALITLTVEIIQHYAQERPLLLILEDVHWLDEASQGIVLALARTVHITPLLLLLVHRPPVREEEKFLREVTALPAQVAMVLTELDPAGVKALVAARLGGPLSNLAASLIQVQAQGNPFFTEELVDALQESEQIQLVDGHWTLADPLVQQLRNAGCLTGHIGQETVSPTAVLSELDLGIPTTIQGIILSRLDRLPEPVKLTVKVASVIGRIFAQDLLIQAHPRRPLEEERYPVQTANANDSLVQSPRVPFAESLAEEIETLLAREFARVEAPAPHPSYIFKHNITQEVVYQTLLTDQRHELHLAVAMALETLLPDGVDALAMHYYNSNLADAAVQAKAVHYLEQAGLRAQHDYANETALSYFNRALALEKRSDWLQTKIDLLHILGWRDEEAAVLQQLNELPDRAIAEVALRWGAYYEALSNYEAAQQHIEAALRHSQQTGDQRAEIRCMSQLGMILARQGDYDGARRQYNTALRIAESDAKFKNEQADLLYGMGSIDRRQGNYQAAQQQLEFALQLNRENDHRPNEAMTLAALGAVAFLLRDYMTAANYYQQALAIRQAIGEREGEAGSLMSLGQVAATEGDYGKTDELVHAALEIFQVVGNRWWQSIGYNTLGIAALDTGRLGAAQQHFQTSLEISRKIGDEAGEAIALLNLGQTFRDQGNLADATKILSQSLQQAQSQGDKDLEAQCWSDLALCWIASADYEQAIEDAEHALTILQEIGLQTALTRDLCTLATAHLNLGNTALAQAFIEQAFAILEECQGEGPDYPQRDYFSCYRIFSELNLINPAEVALQHAHATLQQKSLKISDPTLRSAFLENVAVNRQIIHTASAFSRQR